MAKKYLEMSDLELLDEIHRIEQTLKKCKLKGYKQNGVYLRKLHSEWIKRKK